MSGFVLIHRDLIGNPQFRGKDDVYAAIWLVAEAAWEACTVRSHAGPISLERGQCAHATSYMAKAWECSKDAAHRRLKYLTQCGFIKTQPGRNYTLITICNYNKYQTLQAAPRTQDHAQTGRCPDDARTNKNELNELNKGKTPPKPPSADFEAFWSAYPSGRKQAKEKCRTKFESIVKSGQATAAELIGGAKRYADAGFEGSQYVKGPLGWLNGGCWTDEDLPIPSDKRSLENGASTGNSAKRKGGYDPAESRRRTLEAFPELLDRSGGTAAD